VYNPNPNIPIIDNDSFDSFTYPGGEIQVRLRPEVMEDLETADGVIIHFRIKSSNDVMELLLLQDAIDAYTKDIPDDKKVVILPYLPYSRADRRFVEGDCLGKEVFLKIIRSGWKRIYTLDCHSDKVNDNAYVDVGVNSIVLNILNRIKNEVAGDINVLFPDEGAKNRYSGIVDDLSGVNVFFCQKKRDLATGKFLGFEVPEFDKSKCTIIVDDICDGGGTFLGIADKLQMTNLRLFVTHGIFSKGFGDLSKYFERIYTTNSFSNTYGSNIVETIDSLSYILDSVGEFS
jgi:ribose-phosphate pyrophosphokinase